ncbi:hypothetical protein XI01_16355 [Bradyrhizobium sp. CCBAU 21360]|nr:hypothetical protein [Bradyrhizobium sp. CCBAU 21360]
MKQKRCCPENTAAMTGKVMDFTLGLLENALNRAYEQPVTATTDFLAKDPNRAIRRVTPRATVTAMDCGRKGAKPAMSLIGPQAADPECPLDVRSLGVKRARYAPPEFFRA